MSLTIRALRKSYPNVVAVDGLDLDVRTGECFGLLGPNGAGKTTTIEICEGLTAPDSGDVVVLGRRWTEQPRELRERLGIQLQETQLSEKLTVEETVRLFRSFFREGREIGDVIALVQLDEKRTRASASCPADRSSAWRSPAPSSATRSCSSSTSRPPGSTRNRADSSGSSSNEFRAAGRTIVLTTHYMDEAERLCDRVAIVDHGKVIALGTPRELIASLGVPSTS